MQSTLPGEKTIKAVFFDAAGTLIKPVRPVGDSYAAIAEAYGLKVSAAQIHDRFRACFAAAPPLAFPGVPLAGIEVLERNWWKELVRKIFRPWPPFDDFDQYFDELFAYFAQTRSWSLYPEVMEILAVLKARGLILDVVSNFDSRLITILNGLEVGPWFEEIFISSRVGYAKPDPGRFAAALAHHGLNPENAVHVGDDRQNDLHGAANAGLKAILVERGEPNGTTSSTCVSTLSGVLDMLDD